VVGEGDIDSGYEAGRVGGGLPLVGRQEELGLLLRSWEASKEGHGQVVLIQGEAGIGKSRLVEALREQVSGEDYIWVAIRFSPYHANSTLYPVIEHLKRVMGWKPEDGAEAKLEKLEAALQGQSLPPEEAVPLYAELMSLPLPEGRYALLELSAKQQREQTLDAISGWLMEMAERTPVLQVWEDLHWMDPTTLELLALYIEQSPTVAMMNVLTYRPEFAPPWSMRSHMTPITLNRLERPEVEALIVQQAGGKALPSEVVEHIVNRTDGVPLYVEELTKAILEADFLRERDGGFELTAPLSGVTIPATLQDSLMARLDRLPIIREVAQLGAVLGREFGYEMLQAIASLEETTLQEGLHQLVDAELLYQRGRPPRAKYIFKHALVQDAAYQSLLKRTRQYYHRQVAELLAARYPETAEAHPELLAHHYTEAQLGQPAIAYWRKAGERASQRSANPEAIAHLSKALDLLQTLPETAERDREELALNIALGPALMATKGFQAPESERVYQRGRELAQRVGEPSELFTTTWGLWLVRQYASQLERAQELADEVLVIARQQSDPALQLQAHHAAWTTFYRLAELRSCLDHTEQGIALYDIGQHGSHAFVYGGHDPGVCARAVNAFTLWSLGYPDRALDRVRDAVSLAEKLAHPFTLAFARFFTAVIYQYRRDAALTQRHAEAAMAIAAENDFVNFGAQGLVVRGWAIAAQGQIEQGITEIRQGLRLAYPGEAGTGARRPYFLALLAEAYGWAGQTEQGLRALAEALDEIERMGERTWEPEIHRVKGELLASPAIGNWGEAAACFSRASEIACRQGARSPELRAAMGLARLHRTQGRTEEAHDLLAPIAEWFTEGFDTADLKEAKVLLDELK
jgi:predicted ATPase